MRSLLLPLPLLALLAATAPAHTIILQVDDQGSRLLSGHFGDDPDDLGGFGDCTSCPVQRAAVLTRAGSVQTLDRPAALPGAGDADAAIGVLLAWPARARTRDGTAPLDEVDPDRVLASWRSHASVTHLVAWPGTWPVLFGEGLELQLLGDPATLAPGRALPVRLLRDGAPAAGVAVSCNGEAAGETDPDGRLDVHPGPRGLQRLGASLRLEDPDGLVDELRLSAVLTFGRP